MQISTILFHLVALASAASRKCAPEGALVVGSDEMYTTVSDAVAALANTTEEQVIFIKPGTYNEQVYINITGPLTIYGHTEDDTSYSCNTVTIQQGLSQAAVPHNDLTATLRAWSSDFKLYNVNLKNTYGEGSQALALSAAATNQGYYACQFIGFQDTILANTGYQLYAKSYIEGATDFIFGMYASAWFEQVDIGVATAALGYITASGRQTNDTNWYVINNSTVAAAPGNNVTAGAFYLGRPWRNFARVVFQDTQMSSVIDHAGWSIWNPGDERTNMTTFQEFENTGPGSVGPRANFSSERTGPVAIETVLGEDWACEPYVDLDYM